VTLRRASRVEAGSTILLVVASAFVVSACDCEGPRRELDIVPDIPYPVDGEPELELERVLRSGPVMRDREVVERFELLRAGDLRVVRVRQEWPLGTADLDVVYDADGLPLRVWRRTTMPSASDRVGHRDLRVYDLSGDEVVVAHRGPDGSTEGAAIRGTRPRAVIGPGRGVLAAGIQRHAARPVQLRSPGAAAPR